LLGPMWAGLTPDSKGDPTGDTEEPDRRRQETPQLSARRKGALPGLSRRPAKYRGKKLRVLNPILRLYRIQPTDKSFRMRVQVEMCWKWACQLDDQQPVLRHARGVSARSQSSVCVSVTPGSNRGPPLWFTALLLRVLEAFECYISEARLGCQDRS